MNLQLHLYDTLVFKSLNNLAEEPGQVLVLLC